jgi:RNA polymerase sigma factor (TIGR02999 family)
MAIEDFDWGNIEAELKRAARKILAGHPGPKPSATSLVNDAWLELARSEKWDVSSERHLTALAVQVMRRNIIDAARRFYSRKRGEGAVHEDLDPDRHQAAEDGPEAVLRVNEALEKLKQLDERAATVFEYTYFGGCTQKEIADSLGISESTVRADLRWAKAHLRLLLGPGMVMEPEG